MFYTGNRKSDVFVVGFQIIWRYRVHAFGLYLVRGLPSQVQLGCEAFGVAKEYFGSDKLPQIRNSVLYELTILLLFAWDKYQGEMVDGIARCATNPRPTGSTFISRYVFPDGELVPVNATLRYARKVRSEARDVESLREQYTLTLRH